MNDQLATDHNTGDFSALRGHTDDAVCQLESDSSSDIIESSPFYTQSKQNEHLVDNRLFDLSLNDSDISTVARGQQSRVYSNQQDAVDGCIRGSRDSSMNDYMLQSVDLAGNYYFPISS